MDALTRRATAELGHPPAIRAEPFWTDCALMQDAGITVVMFGPDGGGAHAATEWVTTSSLTTLTDILTATITDLCR